MTTNILINENDGWVEVAFSIITNRGSREVEFFPNDTIPGANDFGHSLGGLKGLNREELPNELEKVWVRVRRGSATLVLTTV